MSGTIPKSDREATATGGNGANSTRTWGARTWTEGTPSSTVSRTVRGMIHSQKLAQVRGEQLGTHKVAWISPRSCRLPGRACGRIPMQTVSLPIRFTATCLVLFGADLQLDQSPRRCPGSDCWILFILSLLWSSALRPASSPAAFNRLP